MENRKRERIIEAGMALLLVITLLAAGQSGKIPVVKSQEIQVQADSGKENESKEKGNTENTDSETTGTEKNSGVARRRGKAARGELVFLHGGYDLKLIILSICVYFVKTLLKLLFYRGSEIQNLL